jgi:Ca2+-transporting ATPase
MWAGIVVVGAIVAVGTLYVLDADLPGGFVNGAGSLRHAQTMAFTTLMLFQLFNVFNSRSEESSALRELFDNQWLWGAVSLSVTLQVCVVYTPFLQRAFSTESLSLGDWLRCTAVASSVVWLLEIQKAVRRLTRAR